MGLDGEVPDADKGRPSSPANKSSVFYRMIVPSIIQDNKLRIPGKFVKKLGDQLPAVVTLTTPNGCVWGVGMKKINDKVWFADGWCEFVKDQSVSVGYLLVFTYVGNSNFVVNIYDLATAEIKYQRNSLSSSEGLNCGDNGCRLPIKEEAEDDELVEILDSRDSGNAFQPKLNKAGISDLHGSSPAAAKKGNWYVAKTLDKALVPYVQYMGCNFTGTELKNSHYKASGGKLHLDIVKSTAQSTRDVRIQCGYSKPTTSAYGIGLHSLDQRPETTRKRNREIELYESELSAKHRCEAQIPRIGTGCVSFLRRWRVVTPEEKERVLNLSKMFHSENPFCRVILRRSYVYRGIGLHMPSSFAEKYLRGVSGFISLQISSGEKWSVRCMSRDGSTKLSKGWPEFVWDNMLEEGDVCVFELIKIEDVVLKVNIFRIVEDAELVNPFPNEHLYNRNTKPLAMI